MDSLAQELIDTVIGNVIKSSLLSCSLVSRRWRRKSQQRAFDTISFSSEDKVNRWCTDISQDSDGISSYVRHVRIRKIFSWNEPVLLGRMLRTLSSLTELSLFQTKIPDEFPGHILRGEFGKGITTLYLGFLGGAPPTTTSMILSLPDLKELGVENYGVTPPEEPPPTYSATLQRGPLNSLKLYGDIGGIGEALAKSRFTSRRLSLSVRTPGVEQLLILSSETVVELKLRGVWLCRFSDRAETIVTNLPDNSSAGTPPLIHLPSLPALTTLVFYTDAVDPSPHLTNILCSIGSAPVLTSITIKFDGWRVIGALPKGYRWADVDGWLSQIAKHAEVTGGLLLTLTQWLEGMPAREELFPRFREAGGIIKL